MAAGVTSGRTVRERAAEIIFGQETPAGKAFDVLLIVAILASVAVVMLESVQPIDAEHRHLLRNVEWGFTILFTVEYALRLWSAPRRLQYAASAFGIVDLVAILPTWLAALFPGAQALLSVRAVRVLRVFRVLKLGKYVSEGAHLSRALRQSRVKITVFLVAVITLVVIVGSLMYVIEGPANGFTSIPIGVYWAIVTLTTVGYGDITPLTPVGKSLAALVMILGYGIIAVPTGIVTVELGNIAREGVPSPACPRCGLARHEGDASFCRRCGASLGRAPAA